MDKPKASVKGASSFFLTLLVVLIPKCPWCIMAYGSAMTVCGGDPIYREANNWVSYIPVVMSAAILFFIVKNWRGWRSYVSLTGAFIGTMLILSTHQTWLGEWAYHSGSVLLFLAIWFNGNLFAFIRTITNRFPILQLKWQR